jgi:hypothetical protein
VEELFLLVHISMNDCRLLVIRSELPNCSGVRLTSPVDHG